MDKVYIKSILFPEEVSDDDRLIKNGDLIDWEFLNLMKEAKSESIRKSFYQYRNLTPTDKMKYWVEIRCPACGKILTKELSKTKIIEIAGLLNKGKFNKGKDYLCEECKLAFDKRKKEEEHRAAIEYKNQQYQLTANYIDRYLNPCRSFEDNLSAKEKYQTIMYENHLFISDKFIQAKILSMDYADFLNTPYWDGVRSYKLHRAKYCCQLCGKKGILNVHHKTYENHGLEHLRIVADKDLIVLCKDCHAKFHDKLADCEVLA